MVEKARLNHSLEFPGSDPPAGGREHTTEARGQDLRSDGQEPRRSSHFGGVPRRQQGRPPYCTGSVTRR